MNQASRFDLAAADWDNNPGRVKLAHAVGDAILSTIPVQPSWRAVDYGAGTGLLTLNLLPNVASVLALDSSEGMLTKLNDKLRSFEISNVRACHWDLTTKPFPETGFDLVASSMTFHHVSDVPLVLCRLAALLTTRGWLAIADLDSEDGSFHGDAADVCHHGFERGQMLEWFAQAGLSQVSIHDAHCMHKASATGEMRSYSVFLAIGQKITTPDDHSKSPRLCSRPRDENGASS